ncbi:hypothetical protein [Streptomyces sp. NPDC000410]|uniref:hypothetical protein n=1 Tax=Streptomyces sp. NPDC000410 TaxID=3154254 RepID=UPI00331CCAC6
MGWAWFQFCGAEDEPQYGLRHSGHSFATFAEARVDLLRHMQRHSTEPKFAKAAWTLDVAAPDVNTVQGVPHYWRVFEFPDGRPLKAAALQAANDLAEQRFGHRNWTYARRPRRTSGRARKWGREWAICLSPALVGFAIALIIILLNQGGVKEVLVFNGNIVQGGDTRIDYRIGTGESRRAPCREMAETEQRYVAPNSGAMLAAWFIFGFTVVVSVAATWSRWDERRRQGRRRRD